MNNIVLLYTEVADTKNIQIQVCIDEALMVKANRNGFNVIIRNFVDNAVKNTDNGIIEITASAEKHYIVIKVCNNDVIESNERILAMQNQLKGIKAGYLKTA